MSQTSPRHDEEHNGQHHDHAEEHHHDTAVLVQSQHHDGSATVTISDNYKNNSNLLHRIKAFCSRNGDQLVGHCAAALSMFLFAWWQIFAKYSLSEFNPYIFTLIRCSIIWLVLLPMMLVVDRNYSFRSSSSSSSSTTIPSSTSSTPSTFSSSSASSPTALPSASSSVSLNKNEEEVTENGEIPPQKHQPTSIGTKFIALFTSKIPGRNQFLLLCITSVLFVCINNMLFVIGLQLTDPVVASIIGQTSTIYVCIIAIVLKNEGYHWLKFAGIAFSVVGAVATIVLNNWNTGSGSYFEFSWSKLIGIGCFLGNNFAYAVCINIQKRLMTSGVPVLTVTFWTFFCGTFALLIPLPVFAYFKYDSIEELFFWRQNSISLYSWLGLLYAGTFGGAFAFAVTSVSSKRLGPTITVIYGCVLPFFLSILSHFVLHTAINYFIFIGAVIIIAGVLMVSIARYRESKIGSVTTSNGGNSKGSNESHIELQEDDSVIVEHEGDEGVGESQQEKQPSTRNSSNATIKLQEQP